MANSVVCNGVARSGDAEDDAPGDKLFSGYKLWFSHTVPQREWFLKNAEHNGAIIVPLDKQADIRLVDHARKNQPVGTHSYKWVELSIRNGRLEDLSKHVVGIESRADRPVGSTVTTARTGRVKYTEEEDQFLWNMVKPFMDSGGAWKGNEIYKQIERINPKHTYQSWRDHWIRVTQFQKRQVTEDIDFDVGKEQGVRGDIIPAGAQGRKRSIEEVDGTAEGRARRSPARTPLRQLQPIGRISAAGTAAKLSHQDEPDKSEAESRPGIRFCTSCFTSESDKWRHDKEGKVLCNDCGRFLREHGVLRASKTWTDGADKVDEDATSDRNLGDENPVSMSAAAPGRVDVGVQTSQVVSPQSGRRHRIKSPSSELQSPTLSRQPESNEARKRSAGRSSQSNSQGSRASNEVANAISDGEPGPRSPELPEAPILQRRKKPRLYDEPTVLEIPPSPEIPETYLGDFDLVLPEESLPSPIRDIPRHHVPKLPSSPLFVPEGDEDKETPTPVLREVSSRASHHSGLLEVNLFSEADHQNLSSSSSHHPVEDDFSDVESSSTTYNFETAANVSQNWETAPQSPIKNDARIETQALFERNEALEYEVDDFALPEPEGGWEGLDMPPLGEDVDPVGPKLDHEPDQDPDENSNQGLDIDMWITSQKNIYPTVNNLDAILQTGIEATSFDFEVANDVVKEVIRLQQSEKSKVTNHYRVNLPQNMPGCWTAEDDDMLCSRNARDVDRVEQKHGRERCNGRFEFLEMWNT